MSRGNEVSSSEIRGMFASMQASLNTQFGQVNEQLESINNRLQGLISRPHSARSHHQKDSYAKPEIHDYGYHYPRRNNFPPQMRTTESPSGRKILPLAIPKISKPLDEVLVPSTQEFAFVRENEQPREAPLGVVDPTTLHLIWESPETERQPLIPVEVCHYTVVEQQIVSCVDEVSTKIDKVQHQDEIVDRKMDDNQFVVVHPDVVTTNESGDKDVVPMIWSLEHHGQNVCGWSHKGIIHVVTPWVTTRKYHRPKINLFSGRTYLEAPFDPGIFGLQ